MCMHKGRISGTSQYFLVAGLFTALAAPMLIAQNTSPAPQQSSGATSDQAACPGVETPKSDASEQQQLPCAVQKALAAMQKRIDELEAELKKKDGKDTAEQPAPSTAAAPAPRPAAAPVKVATETPASAPAEVPAKPSPGPLVATTSKDPTQIPILPGLLDRTEVNKEVATAGFPGTGIPQATAGGTPPPQPAAPAAPPVDLETPFAFADFTWMLSNPRNHDEVLDGKYFSGEFRVDTNYMYDYNHPIDHTLDETTEGERTGEFVIQALGVGGDFHAGNMQGRILTQFGAVSTAVPRNDASYSQGQWDLADAYRYLTEMYAGYHINVQHGLNIQVGDFLSYIGLFSYYSFDNWMYQPSYVSSNTPWFFTGMRAQLFPTNKLKIEPWLINGWQTYAKYNGREGLGGQILWRPTGNLDFVWNTYTLGRDTLYNPYRSRYHEDWSQEWKYYENPGKIHEPDGDDRHGGLRLRNRRRRGVYARQRKRPAARAKLHRHHGLSPLVVRQR